MLAVQRSESSGRGGWGERHWWQSMLLPFLLETLLPFAHVVQAHHVRGLGVVLDLECLPIIITILVTDTTCIEKHLDYYLIVTITGSQLRS